MNRNRLFRPLSAHHARHDVRCHRPNGALLRLFFLASALMLLMPGPDAAAQTPMTQLPRTRLSAGMHQIDAQVAATPDQRSTGLMWRREMPQHEGMLFVFERPETQCFWMKNTLLPLTAAFIDEDGTLVNLADMQPQTTDSHCSNRPVRFVLEMHQGWFSKRGIQPGFRFKGPVFLDKR